VTDVELIEKKLAFIETCVQELRTLARPAAIATDLREERFAAYTLQIAVQAALDVASHIVSDDRLGEPETRPIRCTRWPEKEIDPPCPGRRPCPKKSRIEPGPCREPRDTRKGR
jgi:hypothetical protein